MYTKLSYTVESIPDVIFACQSKDASGSIDEDHKKETMPKAKQAAPEIHTYAPPPMIRGNGLFSMIYLQQIY